jgi:hypothetical protein
MVDLRCVRWSARTTASAAVACLLAAQVAVAAPLPQFSGNAVWNQNISAAAVHPNSASMISTLSGLGGFGNGRMQIDFSIHVVHAAAGAPTRAIVSHPDDYFLPDCEPLGTLMPVPNDAAIEGETGLTCDNLSFDCHLLVVQGRTLYEAYSATANGPNELQAMCLAIWHLDLDYPATLRGDHCTSADAAGFPMAPLLFNADEVAAQLAIDPAGGGDLGHAIRFILPNARMANDPSLGGVGGRLYVRPGTHAGSPSGPVGSVPYGSRLRLRSDFPLTNYSPGARVVLNTMKRYGIVLADGGSVALTAESERYTTATWDDVGISARVFDQTAGAQDVLITDFQVLDTGARIAETWDCVRTNLTPALFANGFETGNTAGWSATTP